MIMAVVYLIAACINCSIWGWAVNKVIENKGYDENWFWWGFFFGFIALLVALTKPDLSRTTIETGPYFGGGDSIVSREYAFKGSVDTRRVDQVPDGWRCQHCGKVNAGYVGTCACGCDKSGKMPGQSSEQVQQETQSVQTQQETSSAQTQQPQILYCTSCGKQIETDFKFCRYCGAKIEP